MITALVLALAGCGSSRSGDPPPQATTAPSPGPAVAPHPQAIEPVAGGNTSSRSDSSKDPKRSGSAVAKAATNAIPTAPASVTSAPAVGAPSDAEVRAEVARFQRAIARYHLDRLNLSGALLDIAQLPPGQYYTSIASVFTDYGLPIACGGLLRVPELGVANKTLPCGTEVIFLYGGRAIRVPVIDRGPYIAGREWDLTGAAAEALHFPGLGPIQWRLG